MSLFPSLPNPPHLLDVFKKFRHSVPPLLDYHDRVLRDESPLSIAEREFIAAYVSGLNTCDFCFGAHSRAARAHGVPEEQLEAALGDLGADPVPPKLRPVLAYVRKLTLEPTRMVPADAQAVYDAGWDEQALHDAIEVCCLYNFMNRLVEGHGVVAAPPPPQTAGPGPAAGSRYSDILNLLDKF